MPASRRGGGDGGEWEDDRGFVHIEFFGTAQVGARGFVARAAAKKGDGSEPSTARVLLPRSRDDPGGGGAWTLLCAPGLADLSSADWPWFHTRPWTALAELDADALQRRLTAAFPAGAPSAEQQAAADVPRSRVFLKGRRVASAKSLLNRVARELPGVSPAAMQTLCACVSQAFIGDAVVGMSVRMIALGGDGVGEDCPPGGALRVRVDLHGEEAGGIVVTARKRLRSFAVDHLGTPRTLARFTAALSARIRPRDGRIADAAACVECAGCRAGRPQRRGESRAAKPMT